ncbi:MAG: penicillin-binding transpeptidase domain-containing protein, partial [Acetobacteraceae bacterium]
TAYASRLANVVMAGKTGTSQVFNLTESAQQQFNTATLPWKLRPNALFIAFAPADRPRYAVSVVVEHGNEGAAAAAPIAHDIMETVLARDPESRNVAPGTAPPPGTSSTTRRKAEKRSAFRRPAPRADRI